MAKKIIGSSLFITFIIALVFLLAMSLSSCRTGYGCHGRESWNGMVKRINRP